MASIRSNNIERARWRSKCRQKLAEHIRNNLGISIEPTQVRLITSADDLYAWKVLPEKERLFKKHMSKHSVRAYMELWREVGISFEAVLAAELGDISQREPQESFAARIEDLQKENANLNNQLIQARDQAVKESDLKKLAEEHASRLKIDNQQLQQEVQKLAMVADRLRGIAIRSSQEVDRILEKLKSELHSLNRPDVSWTTSQNTFYGSQETRWEVGGTDDQNLAYRSIM